MKSKRFISLSALSILSLSLLTGAIMTNTASEVVYTPTVTEAWSTDVKPDVALTYYSAVDGKTGSDLRTSLAGINKPKSKSYDWDRYEAADEAQDDSSSILCVYTRHNIKKTSHCGNYSWDKWNREHVYTQSNFPSSDTDNHNIFACEGQINNYRGNLKFAEVKNSGGNRVVVFGHTTDCYKTSSYFEPCDEAKGEIARACLYCSVYYSYDLNDIFDSIDTCLKWNAEFTVSPREIYRNNIVHGLQGNRNPFADHPSYAKAIYGGPEYQGDDPLGPVEPVSVTGVSLNKTEATIEVNGTVQLTPTITPSNATDKSVIWSTSDSTIASISNSGLVTGVAPGNAVITVRTVDGNFTATCSVTVSTPKLSSIALSGNYPKSFEKDATFSYEGLIVKATYSSGVTKEVTGYTVSSPDMSVVGEQDVTVSYIEDNVTKTATYKITINGETPQPPKKGCGGSVEATSIILSTLSVLGIGLLLIKRKYSK